MYPVKRDNFLDVIDYDKLIKQQANYINNNVSEEKNFEKVRTLSKKKNNYSRQKIGTI